MPQADTQIPPAPPRASRRSHLSVGLWVVASPDSALVGRCLALDKGLELGREAGRDAFGQLRVRVDDAWLSRAHIRVHPASRPTGPWWLEDLQTRNGTFVDGEPTRSRWLDVGAVVRVGASVLVLDRGRIDDEDRGMRGWSAALAELRDEIEQLRDSTRPVHICGETGVGKERVAAALHRASGRSGELLALNMAAIVANLAESQLFGHRRGAFSGAQGDLAGAFDVAHGGTLLLDEIAELELGLQAKLLRAVEHGEIHRVGDPRPHHVDVRLITATHRDLAAEVAAGRFRDDLRWRLLAARLRVPPLRQRLLDIIPIFEHFLIEAGSPLPMSLGRLQPESRWHVAAAYERYLLHDWRGNVRELRSEALRFADLQRARGAAALTTPIPPVEELLAGFEPERRRVDPAEGEAGRRHRSAGGGRVYGADVDAGLAAVSGAADVGDDDGDDGAATVRLDTTLPAPDAGRRALAQALLADPDALAEALQREDGKVKRLATRLAEDLGRTPESTRRTIYRALGDRLAALRDADD